MILFKSLNQAIFIYIPSQIFSLCFVANMLSFLLYFNFKNIICGCLVALILTRSEIQFMNDVNICLIFLKGHPGS